MQIKFNYLSVFYVKILTYTTFYYKQRNAEDKNLTT